VPGNNVLPVKSSAIIQPTDQISTIIQSKQISEINNLYKEYYKYCTLNNKLYLHIFLWLI